MLVGIYYYWILQEIPGERFVLQRIISFLHRHCVDSFWYIYNLQKLILFLMKVLHSVMSVLRSIFF